MHYTFVSPVSCYVGVKTFLMYALYFCQPCLMLCRCEDLSDVLLSLPHTFDQPCLMLCRCEDLSDVCIILLSALYLLCRCEDLSDVCTILFQPCLMLCRCEDLSDVGTILFSALSHVMQV